MMKEDMQGKKDCCTKRNDNWERKQYIRMRESNTIKVSCHENQIT